MDRLSQLRFMPFKSNQNTTLSGSNFEVDSSFDTSKIHCDYFLPEESKKRIENENIHRKFSLFYLNIGSISNKFDSFAFTLE